MYRVNFCIKSADGKQLVKDHMNMDSADDALEFAQLTAWMASMAAYPHRVAPDATQVWRWAQGERKPTRLI